MIKFKKLLILIFMLWLASFTVNPLFAEDMGIKQGDTLSLDDCINIAISNNPSIGLAINTTKIYKSRIGQAKSAYLPQLNVSTGYSRQNPETNGTDRDNNQYAGSISLNQMIYDFGKTPTKTKIQSLNLNSSKSDVDETILQVSYNVKQAYFSALSSKISKDVYTQAIKEYELHLNQAKAFFQVGTKSKIDVTTAEVNLSNARLNYIKADNSYKTAIAILNNAMGLYAAPTYDIADTILFKRPENTVQNEVSVANKESKTAKSQNKTQNKSDSKDTVLKTSIEKFNITENLVFKKFDIGIDEAINAAYANRPDLKSLLLRQSSANESVKLAKKDYLPVVSGFANYGFGGQQFPLDSGWSFGTNINLPVFNGFLTKNQINEARANLDVAKSNLEILKQNIYLQVQQAYISLTETEKRIPVAALTVKQAKENLELANGRYKVGVGNSIEVQDAEINYNNAQLAYVQVFYDYNIAKSSLEKAMGIK